MSNKSTQLLTSNIGLKCLREDSIAVYKLYTTTAPAYPLFYHNAFYTSLSKKWLLYPSHNFELES